MSGLGSQTPAPLGDRTVRSLVRLQSGASTSRTLNLLSVWRRYGRKAEYLERPFFRNATLNRSIIVKHRLRPNERDLFFDGRTVATKVILPIDLNDLRSGARSFFISQIAFEEALAEICGRDNFASDQIILQMLDVLPSLDPFLLRERMRSDLMSPARCYFELSEADHSRMFEFVRREIRPLIGKSFGHLQVGLSDKTGKLATKILENAADEDLEPLRISLGLEKDAFQEGMFCWKGFLYYKWCLKDLVSQVRPITTEIAAARPTGPASREDRAHIAASRTRLTRSITQTGDNVRATLAIYDNAFTAFTQFGQAQAFRDFLVQAPDLFQQLGERLGALQHIVSFWRFRFPKDGSVAIAADELMELLSEFEVSISFADDLDRPAA